MIRRTLILLAVAGATAAPAAAQSGVVVDPSSPTGKEYAIPLDSARRDAAGGRSSAASGRDGSTSAPLFGEGVGDASPPSSSGSTPTTAGETGQKRSRRPAASGGGAATLKLERARTRPVAAAIPDGGSGSTLTVIAVALSVLLLGGVIGSIARRRSS